MHVTTPPSEENLPNFQTTDEIREPVLEILAQWKKKFYKNPTPLQSPQLFMITTITENLEKTLFNNDLSKKKLRKGITKYRKTLRENKEKAFQDDEKKRKKIESLIENLIPYSLLEK